MLYIITLEKSFYLLGLNSIFFGYSNSMSNEGVSKFRISLINPYFRRPHFDYNVKFRKLVTKVSDRYVFGRFNRINPSFVGLRVGVYQGFRFFTFRIRSEIVGSFFADFVQTYQLSPNIGLKKKRGFSGARNKRLISRSAKK